MTIEEELAESKRREAEHKADLDRIAKAVYPQKGERFTYSVDFVIEEIKMAQERTAELQASKNVLSGWIIDLEARVKTLEDALRRVSGRCLCGGVIDLAEQALAAKEPKA